MLKISLPRFQISSLAALHLKTRFWNTRNTFSALRKGYPPLQPGNQKRTTPPKLEDSQHVTQRRTPSPLLKISISFSVPIEEHTSKARPA